MTASQAQAESKRGRSKADLAYDYLREQVLGGTLAPRQRVLAGPIAAQLQISAVPVREAIHRLAAEGLLQIERNVGARVAEIGELAYREGMEALAVLDGSATALAALALGGAALDRAEQINEQLAGLLGDFDPAEYTRLNTKFHAVLHAGCPNARLRELVEAEWRKFSALHAAERAVDAERAHAAVDEHRELLRLIRDGAPAARIEQAARDHVLSSLHARTGFVSQLR